MKNEELSLALKPAPLEVVQDCIFGTCLISYTATSPPTHPASRAVAWLARRTHGSIVAVNDPPVSGVTDSILRSMTGES